MIKKCSLDEGGAFFLEIDDEPVKFIFDQTLSHSYLNSAYLEKSGMAKLYFGKEGFYLHFQPLNRDVFLIDEEIDGILGTDIFRYFNVTLTNQTISFEKKVQYNVTFLTGAGISQESGIETFRGENGLWNNIPIERVCTADAYQYNKEEVIEFYNQRRLQLSNKVPNKTHLEIAKFQNKYPNNVFVITQNVDNLLEKAGCNTILHLHGYLPNLRCSNHECDYVINIGYALQENDVCPLCHQALRPDIVFFNEPAPNYALLENILNKTDILVVIGTSGQVLNINKMATRVSFSLFSTLEQSSVVNDTLFDNVIYGKATETIDSIIEIIENKLIVHS